MTDLDGFRQPIQLWGTTGVMTRALLARLLDAHFPLAALVIPGEGASSPQLLPPPPPAHDELPLLDAFVQPTALHLAWNHRLPVYRVGRLHEGVAAWLAEQAPAAVVVACFPRRIPAALLAVPRLGFLNVHPSHLPAYRGPAPLFWQLHDDVQPLGVTLHLMDTHFDTGDIVGQVDVPRRDGATGPELDAALGAAGGDLAAAALSNGLSGRRVQPAGGSYQSWPTPADFALDPAWSARRAYNFLCGTAEWGYPYLLQAAGQRWRVDRALGWETAGVLPAPVVEQDGILHIQFNPGCVRASGERVR